MNKELNEAAEKYADSKERRGCGAWCAYKQAYIDFHNQVLSDEEIEKLIDDNFKASLADNNGEPLYTDADLQQGFKSALQYSAGKSFYCWHKDATDEEPCKEQCDICKNSKAINK